MAKKIKPVNKAEKVKSKVESKVLKNMLQQEIIAEKTKAKVETTKKRAVRKVKSANEKEILENEKLRSKVVKAEDKAKNVQLKGVKKSSVKVAKTNKKIIKKNVKAKRFEVKESISIDKSDKKASIGDFREATKKAKKLSKEELKDTEVNTVVGDSIMVPEIKQSRSIHVNMEEDVVLKVKNLTVSFKKKEKTINVIRGVDLTIKKGEIVGLVGESGSGKSVTTKALLDINKGGITTADKAHLAGYDLNKLRNFNKVRGSKIGYIPQDPMTALNPTRQIWKQINDVLLVHRKELKTKSSRIKYIIEILEKFGIRNAEQKIMQFPHSFSGGMRQRVVIAMVVAAKPDLIIADEPTTALDPTVQASVLELLEEIRVNFRISIIFISHNMSVVAKFVDYIYVMYAGKIVERGTTTDVFTDPRHPYTWALISALPEEGEKGDLFTIGGTPPNLEFLPTGDPFAPRNAFALEIDFKREPELFSVSETHSAATWLLHPSAAKVSPPVEVQKRIKSFKKVWHVK